MDRLNEEVLDLGAATVETRGVVHQPQNDAIGTLSGGGLSDDE